MAECPICYCSWTDPGREPKVLPCGHTFCNQCLSQLPSAVPGIITCPTCRAECQEAEVSTNFALRDMLLAQRKGVASNGPSAPSSAPPPLHEPLLPTAPPTAESPPTTSPSLAPVQQAMNQTAAQPWALAPGFREVYEPQLDRQQRRFPVPEARLLEACQVRDRPAWIEERKALLRSWGTRREEFMHRPPACLMDQMVSGSGCYPLRMLEDAWFLPEEQQMVQRLERLLQGTGNVSNLARDMLTPVVYDIDVRIVLDNSGSMQLDMFGQVPDSYGGYGGRSGAWFGGSSTPWIDQQSREDPRLLQQNLQQVFRKRPGRFAVAPPNSPLSPFHRRWFYARDALRRWQQVYGALGMNPPLYLLNGSRRRFDLSQLEQLFQQQPSGGTPLTDRIEEALQDHIQECPNKTMLLLVITDGEADNMWSFNTLLDSVQNNMYGDVQVCFVGLSLIPRDIEWFENEECDETRIRTVEAYEVEQRQIQLREVVSKEGGYNFEMHTYRVLLTNFFPADYDYEAPLQNFRHRLYITWHGRDRWWGINNSCYRLICSNLLCTACFLCTGCHCLGYCQGNDCGKCQKPDMLEGCCEGEE